MPAEPFAEELPDGLKAVEAALRGLTPSAGRIDRDRLMYSAGRNSVQQIHSLRRFAWPLATAALVLLSLGLAGRLLYVAGRGQPVMVVQNRASDGAPILARTTPGISPGPTAVVFSPVSGVGFNYMQLRNTVLNRGIEALPQENIGSAAATPAAQFPHWPSVRDDLLGS